jgi:hypothetical protein
MLTLAVGAGLLMASAAQSANIAWMSPHAADDMPHADAVAAGFTMAPDVGYTDLLEANGHTVTRVVLLDNGANDFNALNAFDLVMISRGANSGNFQTAAETAAWNSTLTAPTVVMGGYLIRNVRLGYTTGGTIPDTAGAVKLQTSQPTHPIFNGIALDGTGTMTSDYTTGLVPVPHNTAIVHRGISVNTDNPRPGGTVLAQINTPGDPADSGANGGMIIGLWDAGAAVIATDPNPDITYNLGGPRLVFLSGSREQDTGDSDTAGMMDLTATGKQLFLNAVNYMINLGGQPGDADGDGDVDMNDFNAIRDNFQQAAASRAEGDLTGDGTVDFKDFRQWKANHPFTPAPAGAVPEPGTIALGLMAAAAALAGARSAARRSA